LKSLLFFANALTSMLTLGGYAAGYINPSEWPMFGFLGLALPVLMLTQVLFALIWLLFGDKRMALPVLILLLGYGNLGSIFQLTGKEVKQKQPETLRILSYNTMLFNMRDSQPLWYITSAPLQKAIDDVEADILVFQEYNESPKQLRFENYKHRYVKTGRGSGLAILSKYPIINSGEITNPIKDKAYRGFLYADIVVGSDTVRVINIHLISIALAQKDLKVFVQPEGADQEKIKKSGKRIAQRLYGAFAQRGEQVDAMVAFINDSPYKVILCGDFNDTPGSYTYRQFTNVLKDSFVQAGSGFGTTHPKFARYHVPLRIDHIMHHPNIKAVAHSIVNIEYSDHFPVVTDLVL